MELDLGKGVSPELKKFVECFQPYAAKTAEAEELRQKGFKLADPNGNGARQRMKTNPGARLASSLSLEAGQLEFP